MIINNNIKVSVVVPVFKSELYIHQLLSSIINQTYRNLEIILIDDGSPDNSGAICDDYAANDSRIIVIHKQNGGGCAARNDGIDLASGEYIMFVDGDDWLALDFVEYFLNVIISTGAEMALSTNNFTTNDLNQISEPETIEKWTNERALVAIILPEIAIGCWNKLYKTSLIKDNNIRFDVPWYGEGLYFSSMAASYANHVGVGNKKVYYYRRNNPISATTLYNIKNAKNAIWNIVNIRNRIPLKSNKIKWVIDQHIRGNYYEALEAIIATKCIQENVLFFIKCWILYFIYTPIVIVRGKYSMRQVYNMIVNAICPFDSLRTKIEFRLQMLEKIENTKR